MKKFFVSRRNGVSKIHRESYGSSWFKLSDENRNRLGHTCVDCKTYLGEGKGDSHHITPLSRRGANTKLNLTLLCNTCHKKRHPRARNEWEESRMNRFKGS